MPWFKVDDGFCVHPKTVGLDMSARGLWVTAGSWCAQQLTDGVITDKQIRMLGGTRRQAEKLVESGLWTADDAPPSARRYTFNDWRDFQPGRDEVMAERERARERMAVARAKKKQTSKDAKKFARTSAERSEEVRSSGLDERSPYPDPTRPDPTHIEGKVGGETTGSKGAGDEAPSPEISADVDSALDALAATAADRPHTRGVCPRHPDGDTGQACQGCAQAKREREYDAQAEKRSRQSAIDSCHWCDDRGLVEAHDQDGRPVALKCHHRDSPPVYEPPAPDPEPRFDPADFLNKLRERNTPTRGPADLPATGTGPF